MSLYMTTDQHNREMKALQSLVERMDKELYECRTMLNKHAARIEELERKTVPLNVYGSAGLNR